MNKPTSPTIRFTLDLDPVLHKALRLRAVQENRSAADLCRELIAAYLGQAEDLDEARLRAAYDAGARAERDRIVTSALSPSEPPTRPGLPTQRPVTRP